MRRLVSVLGGAFLILAFAGAGVLAAPADQLGPATPRVAANGAPAACDMKLALEDGPLKDDLLQVKSMQWYYVHGFGFPPSTTLTIEFSRNGSVSDTFHANSDVDGAFVKGAFWTMLLGSSALEQEITVYDPADKAGCSDAAILRVVPSGWTSPFTDIKGHTFEDDIVWLYESGITKGCTTTLFCPDDGVARGQMAAFLVRALDLPTTATDYFTDDETSTFEGDIDRLAAAGITKGCTATSFCPATIVTRGQMAAFLVRALDLPTTTTDFFTDDQASSFHGDINRLAASGVTKGCTATSFCPATIVTRGQMAAFLHRGLDPEVVSTRTSLENHVQ